MDNETSLSGSTNSQHSCKVAHKAIIFSSLLCAALSVVVVVMSVAMLWLYCKYKALRNSVRKGPCGMVISNPMTGLRPQRGRMQRGRMKRSMNMSRNYVDASQLWGRAEEDESFQERERYVDSGVYDNVWNGEISGAHYDRLALNEGARNQYLTIVGTRGLTSQLQRERRGWREAEEVKERESGKVRRKTTGTNLPLLDGRETGQGRGKRRNGRIHGNHSESEDGSTQPYRRYSEGNVSEEERDMACDSYEGEAQSEGGKGRRGGGKRVSRLVLWGKSLWSTAKFDRSGSMSLLGSTSPIREDGTTTPTPLLPPPNQPCPTDNTALDPPTFVVSHQTPRGVGVRYQCPRDTGAKNHDPRCAGVSPPGRTGTQGAEIIEKDVKPRSKYVNLDINPQGARVSPRGGTEVAELMEKDAKNRSKYVNLDIDAIV